MIQNQLDNDDFFLRCYYEMLQIGYENMKVVGEIGLNHLGSEELAEDLIIHSIEQGLKNVTFQIREESYYDGSKPHRVALPDSSYEKLISISKASGVSVGFACSDLKKVDYLHSIGAEFWKVLSKDLPNYELIRKLQETNKEVSVSTGLASINEIEKMLSIHREVSLIHTQLSHSIVDVNLRALDNLRLHGRPVHFGLHAEDLDVLILSLAFQPNSIWFYIKPEIGTIVPDDVHAIPIRDVGRWINKLETLQMALGDGEKKSMERMT